MYEYVILSGISKVPFRNSKQNILPIHWKIQILYNIEILRALRFKSSYAFFKCPPDRNCTHTSATVMSHIHPWTNMVKILSWGTSQPSLTALWEDLHK